MAGQDQVKAEPVTGSAPLAERAVDDHAAADTPQRAPAQEGLLQTPQRMASASAFSVFMSPLVRGSGRMMDNAHVLHCCCCISKAVTNKTIWNSMGRSVGDAGWGYNNDCVSSHHIAMQPALQRTVSKSRP